MLGVVTGVGLVRDQGRQIRHMLFEVGIDRHPGPEITEVVIESRPRLVADDLVFHLLVVRQTIAFAHQFT